MADSKSLNYRFSNKKILRKYEPVGNISKKLYYISEKIRCEKIGTNYFKGAKILQGTHNFSTFRAASCSARSPIKKLNLVKVTKKNDKIIIKFQSKSFLQNQVRSMVGCLKYLSIKKWDLKKFNYVFKSKDRKLCAPPAPPHGLYLKNVIY